MKEQRKKSNKAIAIMLLMAFFLSCRQVLFSAQGIKQELTMSPQEVGKVEQDLERENIPVSELIQTYFSDIPLPPNIKSKLDSMVVQKFEKKPGPTTFRESIAFVGEAKYEDKVVPIQIVLAKKLFAQVIGKEKYAKTLISLTIPLPKDWKLSDMYSELSFLDGLHFNDAAFVLSSFKYSDKQWGTIYKGLNFTSHVNVIKAKVPVVTDFLELLSGITKFDLTNVTFAGLIISKKKEDFAVRFKVPSDISLPIKDPVFVDGMKFTGVSIGVKPFEKIFSLGASFEMNMKDVKDPLKIGLGGSAKVGIGIDTITLSGTMTGLYKPAFRIPWLSMKDLALVVGFDLPTRAIKKFEFRGLADAGEGDAQLKVDVAGKVNISKDKPPEIALFGDINEASLQKLVLLFSQIVGQKIPVDWLPAYKIKPATVAFIPEKTEIAGKTYDSGTFVRGGIDFFGLKGNMYVHIKQKLAKGEGAQEAAEFTFDGYGDLQKIDYPYFKFTGIGPDKIAGTKDDGPIVRLKVSPEKQRLFLNGDIEIPFLGIRQQADIDIKLTKMEGLIKTKIFEIFDGALNLSFNPTKIEEMALGLNLTGGFDKLEKALPEAFKTIKSQAGKGLDVPGVKDAVQALISAVDEITSFASKGIPVTIKSISTQLNANDLQKGILPDVSVKMRLNWLNKDLTLSTKLDVKNIPKTAATLAKKILDTIVKSPLDDLMKAIQEGLEELEKSIFKILGRGIKAELSAAAQNQINTIQVLLDKVQKNPILNKAPNTITQQELAQLYQDYVNTQKAFNAAAMVKNMPSVKNPFNEVMQSKSILDRIKLLDPAAKQAIDEGTYEKYLQKKEEEKQLLQDLRAMLAQVQKHAIFSTAIDKVNQKDLINLYALFISTQTALNNQAQLPEVKTVLLPQLQTLKTKLDPYLKTMDPEVKKLVEAKRTTEAIALFNKKELEKKKALEKLAGAERPDEKVTPQAAITFAQTMQKQLEANPILKKSLNTITQEELARYRIDFDKAFDHANKNLFGNAQTAALSPLNALWRSSMVQQRITRLNSAVQQLISQKNYTKAIEDAKTIDDPNWRAREAAQKAGEALKKQIQQPKFSF